MALGTELRRNTRPNKYDDIGIRGRKTGITLTGKVTYDEDGFEDEDEFFNMTSPSANIKNVRNNVARNENSINDLVNMVSDEADEGSVNGASGSIKGRRLSRRLSKTPTAGRVVKHARTPSAELSVDETDVEPKTTRQSRRLSAITMLKDQGDTSRTADSEARENGHSADNTQQRPRSRQQAASYNNEDDDDDNPFWAKKVDNPRTMRRKTLAVASKPPSARSKRRMTAIPGSAEEQTPVLLSRSREASHTSSSARGTARRTGKRISGPISRLAETASEGDSNRGASPVSGVAAGTGTGDDGTEVESPTQPLVRSDEEHDSDHPDLTIVSFDIDGGDFASQAFDEDDADARIGISSVNNTERSPSINLDVDPRHDDDDNISLPLNSPGTISEEEAAASPVRAEPRAIGRGHRDVGSKARGGKKTSAASKGRGASKRPSVPVPPQAATSEEGEAGQVRRSKRTRIKPLEYWRNEHIVYKIKKDEESGTVIPAFEKIASPSKNEDELRKKAPKRRRTTAKRKPKERRWARGQRSDSETDDYSASEEDGKGSAAVRKSPVDLNQPPHIEGVVLNEYGEEVTQSIVCAHSNVNMVQPENLSGVMEIGHIFKQVHDTYQFLNSGFIKLFPRQSKPARRSDEKAIVFYVVRGHVRYHVNEQSFEVFRGGHFQVPRNNQYSIENLEDRPAMLFFVQVSFPLPPLAEEEEEDGEEMVVEVN